MSNDLLSKIFLGNTKGMNLKVSQGGISIFHQLKPMYYPITQAFDEEGIEVSETMGKDVARNKVSQDYTIDTVTIGVGNTTNKIFPFIKSVGYVSRDQAFHRMVGYEKQYDVKIESVQTRMLWYALKTMVLSLQKNIRRQELFCWELLQSGKLTTQNGVLNFNPNARLVGKTVTKLWTDATSDPLVDLGNALKVLRQAGKGVSGTPIAIMGDNAINNFITRMKAQGSLLETRIASVNLDPTLSLDRELAFLVSSGFEYHGYIRTTFSARKIHIFHYPEYYAGTGGGESTNTYVDTNNCIVMYFNPNYYQTHYGANQIGATDSAFLANTFGDLTSGALSEMLQVGKVEIMPEAITTGVFPSPMGEGVYIVMGISPLPYIYNINSVCCFNTAATTAPIGA